MACLLRSLGSLFLAGILPGLLIAVLYAVAYLFLPVQSQTRPIRAQANLGESLKGLAGIWGILLLFILVLGGMYGGIFTPSESGAIGAFGALILGLLKGTLGWKGFKAALTEPAFLQG